MIDLPALLLFVMLALGGTLHCLGMCGGVALAVAASGSCGSRRLLAWQGAYALGKASTYALLGGAVSLGGGALVGRDPLGRTPVGASLALWLPLLAGVILVVIGLRRLGLLGRDARSPVSSPGGPLGILRRLMIIVREQRGVAGPFGTGVLNGLLPCGLSLGALALAVAVAPATAFLGMFLFGLGTAPGLIALGWVPRLATLPLRRHAVTLQGVAWVLSGVFLAGRPLLSSDSRRALPAPCCSEHDGPVPGHEASTSDPVGHPH